jgi:hypothetical protein
MATWEKYLAHGEILDIGGSRMYDDVGEQLAKVLRRPYDPKHIPTLPDELLYHAEGLEWWNKIIWQKPFYQTHDEIRLFDAHGADIISRMQPGVTMIDLGAGYVTPTNDSRMWTEFVVAETPEKSSIYSRASSAADCRPHI